MKANRTGPEERLSPLPAGLTDPAAVVRLAGKDAKGGEMAAFL